MSERALPYNKVLEIEDFADPGLAALMREVFPDDAARRGPGFPAGSEYRKHWEVAMTVRALGDFGSCAGTRPCWGSGRAERTLFHLTRHVGGWWRPTSTRARRLGARRLAAPAHRSRAREPVPSSATA